MKRRGFTLVEIVAACGLLAAIMAMTAVIVLSSVTGFARSAERDMARQLGMAVYDFYRGRLISAREISDGPIGGGAILTIDGKIHYAPPGGQLQPLYPDSVYPGGARVSVTLEGEGGLLRLRVEVSGLEGLLFSKESAFRPLTLERLGRQADFPSGEVREIYFN